MRISDNWDDFEGLMFKAFENYGKGQLIPLNFSTNLEGDSSNFNKAIDKAIGV